MSEKQGPKFQPKQDYPSNSINSRANVVIKPTLWKTIVRGFVPNIDNLDFQTLLSKIVLPQMRDAAWNTLGTLMYGNGDIPAKRNANGNVVVSGNNANATAYNRMFNGAAQGAQQNKQTKQQFRDYRDIVFEAHFDEGEDASDARKDAEELVAFVRYRVENSDYHCCSIYEIFDHLGITRENILEDNWGFTPENVSKIMPIATGEPGKIRVYFPKAVELPSRVRIESQ